MEARWRCRRADVDLAAWPSDYVRCESNDQAQLDLPLRLGFRVVARNASVILRRPAGLSNIESHGHVQAKYQ